MALPVIDIERIKDAVKASREAGMFPELSARQAYELVYGRADGNNADLNIPIQPRQD